MVRRNRIRAGVPVAALVGSTLAFGLAPTAWADPAPRADYGQHVSQCAQAMGFSGEMNPGMHQGLAGWTGAECAALPIATAP